MSTGLDVPSGPSMCLHKGSDVLQWDFEDQAWINLGSSDIRLNVVDARETPIREGEGSVGDRRVLRLAASGIKVTVDVRTTLVCAEDDESCEAWSEEGVITAVAEHVSSTMRVKGICGS